MNVLLSIDLRCSNRSSCELVKVDVQLPLHVGLAHLSLPDRYLLQSLFGARATDGAQGLLMLLQSCLRLHERYYLAARPFLHAEGAALLLEVCDAASQSCRRFLPAQVE